MIWRPWLLLFALAAPAGAEEDRPLTAGDLEGIPWRSVGPANVGGRVAAIALVPGSRREFYVGYATGGVFKTDNLGVTFTPGELLDPVVIGVRQLEDIAELPVLGSLPRIL